jgi:hypothetical protein
MLSDGEGIARPALEKIGVNVAQLGHAPLRRLVNANQTMPSLNPLWSLAAGLVDVDWRELTDQSRERSPKEIDEA